MAVFRITKNCQDHFTIVHVSQAQYCTVSLQYEMEPSSLSPLIFLNTMQSLSQLPFT